MYWNIIGTSHYLVDGNDTYYCTYPQYLTLNDYYNDRITEDEMPAKLCYYESLEECVLCPVCKNGSISRKMAIAFVEEPDIFDMSFHGHLIHNCKGG